MSEDLNPFDINSSHIIDETNPDEQSDLTQHVPDCLEDASSSLFLEEEEEEEEEKSEEVERSIYYSDRSDSIPEVNPGHNHPANSDLSVTRDLSGIFKSSHFL